MTRKTAAKQLKKVTNEWLESITDESLRSALKNHVIITGGAVASLLTNEDVNDYDVYISDRDVLLRLSNYYCDVFNSIRPDATKLGTSGTAWVLDGADVAAWKAGHKELSSFAHGYEDMPYSSSMEWDAVDKIPGGPSGMLLNTDPDRVKIMINSDGVAESDDQAADNVDYDVEEYVEQVDPDNKPKLKYQPVFMSSNAITLSNKIQIVIRFHGDPEEIHSNYDFVHCTGYWHSKDSKIVVDVDVLEALMNKRLVYRGSKYPIASLIRTRKFIKRGFHINAGQYLKMAFQINELDLSNIYVLEDQLTGVDSIYFMQFIHQIREQIEAGKQIDITGQYVADVIDKIFS